jgi:pyruvate/2-oxoglutarate dehydrogenase complex dihydrolipoamide acyltransferase (E2) component
MCGGNPIGDIFSGIENVANAQMADATAKGNAKTVQSVARAQADKTKRQGKANASSARAAAAENGLDVDQGAAAMLQDEHISDAAYNASLGIADAENQAQQIRQQAKMQRNNYGMNAASSFVSAGMKIAGWK